MRLKDKGRAAAAMTTEYEDKAGFAEVEVSFSFVGDCGKCPETTSMGNYGF